MDESARVDLVIAATPARLWRAHAAAGLTGWLCERAAGELRAGATLELGWPSLGLEAALEVAEVEPERRLVLRGAGDAAGQWSETTLAAGAGGATRITVRHGGLGAGGRGRDRAAGTSAGWHVALRLLDLYLCGREGRALTARSAVGTSAAPVAELWPMIAEPGPLGRWLGPVAGALAGEGDRATLTLAGRRLAALVLARAAPYELALALPAIDAVLRLRLVALEPAGPTLVCAQLLGWDGAGPLEPLAAPLAAALARLLGARGGDA